MKTIKSRFFGLLKNTGEEGLPHEDGESRFFALSPEDAAALPQNTAWGSRAQQVKAAPLDGQRGMAQLRQLWQADQMMSALHGQPLERMAPFVTFATVATDKELILQDELGDYMLVLLRGAISVVRKQEWGDTLVLANVQAGEMLGEMSLLDGGIRFSTCVTRSECDIAVLSADGLDQMIAAEPQIAASLIALLARKLSLRLRVVSARLGSRKA
ncbi:MAG: cyclic nucleotide-binding domain-containing protein [Burkholderiales bacterium]|nr:cyclic nucleotide-binding domain-containing protein [Burkholderiales bacterium]